MSSNSKYWFSSQATGRFVRVPISREGRVFTASYVIVGLIAVILTIPKSQNPTWAQYFPLILIAIVLTTTYVTVTTAKAAPKSSGK